MRNSMARYVVSAVAAQTQLKFRFQASVLAIAYYDLPQRDYVAKRRFQPKSPILFRTQTTEYIRLFDALQGTLHGLLGPDDAVFSGDNLSQKQSIRLEVRRVQFLRCVTVHDCFLAHQIVGCPSFERQINVRNPANNGKSITRAKVAEKIAKEIADYMKVHPMPTKYASRRQVTDDLIYHSVIQFLWESLP